MPNFNVENKTITASAYPACPVCPVRKNDCIGVRRYDCIRACPMEYNQMELNY